MKISLKYPYFSVYKIRIQSLDLVQIFNLLPEDIFGPLPIRYTTKSWYFLLLNAEEKI